MWPHNNIKTVLILMPLAFAFAVALDLYIPAVPQLTHVFHSTPAQIQLTLSGFMFAFGIGQLVVGPYSDQFGRRPIALLSAIGYLFSSLLCSTSNSLWSLILFRMLEAISSCGMLVAANAVVRDIYSGNDSARMYSYLNGAIAMSPMLAPFIGGYVDTLFGWRACFLSLAIFGLIATLIVFFCLRESHHVNKRLKVDTDVFKRYRIILKNRAFWFYSLFSTFGVICLFTFFSTSPYILINDLGISREHFGWYFGVMGLLFFVGSLFAAKTVTTFGLDKNLLLGTFLIFIGGLLMFAWYSFLGLSTSGFIWPMVPIALGAGFVIGAGAAGAMESFADMAGTAAALYGCFEFLIAGIVGNIVLQFPMGTSLPLASTVALVGLTGLVMFAWTRVKTKC